MRIIAGEMSQHKIEIYKKAQSLIDEKINTIQGAIDEARAAANNESKSSAGDKHETARAMMQLEQEKNARQLNEAQKLKKLLHSVSPEKLYETGALGALMKTSIGDFYILVSLGKVKVGKETCFLLSPAAPVAQQLLGKKKGDTFTFNGKSITISNVI